MKNRYCRATHFSMVEIVLALVIVVIGIIGIMALFPVVQKEHQTATGVSNSQDAGTQFLNLFASKIKAKWSIIAALPQENPGDTVNDSQIAQQGLWQTADSNNIFTPIAGLELSYHDQNNNHRFDYQLDQQAQSLDDDGLFKLVQRSGGDRADFDAILRVWHAPVVYKPTTGATGYQVASRERAIQLNIELSWPAAVPYLKREKVVMHQVVYRPSEEPVEAVRGAFRISEAGKIQFHYFGSSAGYKNGFWMAKPNEVMVFEQQQANQQDVTLDTNFDAGSTFNFYTRVQPDWGNAAVYWKHYAWADPACAFIGSGVSGQINVNPNNSDDFEFTMTKANGSTITRDDLLADSSIDYNGPVTMVRFKPKGNANQNGLVFDGVPVELKNGTLYTLTSTNMTLHLYNANAGHGRSMGKWWMDNVVASNGKLEGGDLHLETGTVPATCDIPYYDTGDATNRNGAHCKKTGNAYCVATEMIPGRKWLFGFEDLPGYYSWTDWDYNDIVVSAELNPDDGVIVPSLGGHQVRGRIDAQASGHADWRITVVKPNGTLFERTSMTSYTGPALAVWVRPQGNGSQTMTVDGQAQTWNNANLLAIASYHMNVVVTQSGSHWVCDVDATDADFSVMN